MFCTIRQALAKGVSDHQPCALDIAPLHLFQTVVRNMCNGRLFKHHQLYFRKIQQEQKSNMLFEKCAREAASLGPSSIYPGFNFDFTYIEFPFHFDSLRFSFDDMSASRRCHFELTSVQLRFNFDFRVGPFRCLFEHTLNAFKQPFTIDNP